MDIPNWIQAVSSVIALVISIWAIISSKKNAEQIMNVTEKMTNIGNIVQKLNSENRNISFNGVIAQGNGRDGVHVG